MRSFDAFGKMLMSAMIASSNAASVVGAPVNLGLLILGADLQPISPVAWLWDGTADTLGVDRADDGNGPIRGLSIGVGSTFTGRRRPAWSFWTSPDQRARSSDDAFCDNVAGYNIGTTRVWPI